MNNKNSNFSENNFYNFSKLDLLVQKCTYKFLSSVQKILYLTSEVLSLSLSLSLNIGNIAFQSKRLKTMTKWSTIELPVYVPMIAN